MATQYRTVSSVNFSLALLFIGLCLGYLLFTVSHVEANEANANTPVNDRKLIDKINSDHTHGWEATEYPRFANMTISQLRDSLFGVQFLPNDPDSPRIEGEPRITLPTTFDARSTWANCVPAIRDQQSCGSCVYFSSSYV